MFLDHPLISPRNVAPNCDNPIRVIKWLTKLKTMLMWYHNREFVEKGLEFCLFLRRNTWSNCKPTHHFIEFGNSLSSIRQCAYFSFYFNSDTWSNIQYWFFKQFGRRLLARSGKKETSITKMYLILFPTVSQLFDFYQDLYSK